MNYAGKLLVWSNSVTYLFLSDHSCIRISKRELIIINQYRTNNLKATYKNYGRFHTKLI